MKSAMFARPVAVVLAVSLFSLVGCKKGPALEEMKKVEEACAAKDKEKAVDIAIKAAESNSSFKKAFDEVFKGVEDKKKVNVCGALPMVELRTRIENGPAI